VAALGRVVRTTAFKLSRSISRFFPSLPSFSSCTSPIRRTSSSTEQLRDTIAEEIRGLAGVGRSGGLTAIVDTIEQRSHEPGASLYLITDVNGRILAGNVSDVPQQLLERSGWAR